MLNRSHRHMGAITITAAVLMLALIEPIAHGQTVVTYDLSPDSTAATATGQAQSDALQKICSTLHGVLDPRNQLAITVTVNPHKQIEIMVPDAPHNPGQVSKPVMDIAELQRRIGMLGGLSFHIVVTSSQLDDAQAVVEQLQKHGPTQMRVADKQQYRWVMIDDPARFVGRPTDLTRLKDNPESYFAEYRNLVGGRYDGDYYLLVWNTPDKAMANWPQQAGWDVSSAAVVVDRDQHPAVRYDLNEKGRLLMRTMTGANVNQPMAMVIGGRIYSPPPVIREPLAGSVEMTGGRDGYSPSEAMTLAHSLMAGRHGVGLCDTPASVETR